MLLYGSWIWKSNHMLIADHTFIVFGKIIHPTCLFRTTLLFGPLEYIFFLPGFIWAQIEYMVHVPLPKWPIKQFKQVWQMRQQSKRAYCSDIYIFTIVAVVFWDCRHWWFMAWACGDFCEMTCILLISKWSPFQIWILVKHIRLGNSLEIKMLSVQLWYVLQTLMIHSMGIWGLFTTDKQDLNFSTAN